MAFIYPEDRNQIQFPTSYESMISKYNPVRIIDMIVDKIIQENPDEYKRTKESHYGAPSYMTSTFLKLYLYGYINQIPSSRKLEKATHRNIEVIWLLGNLKPDYWVIAQFRKEHGDLINKATSQFRAFLRSQKYIDLKRVVLDGTKVKANAKRDMLTLKSVEKQLQTASAKMDDYLLKLSRNDIIDESIEKQSQASSSQEINMDLVDKIAELQERIAKLDEYKKQMEEKGLNRISTTDPEAKLMKSRDGKFPCYNVQSFVDTLNHMIANTSVTDAEADAGQLEPASQELEEEYDETPDELIADKGYFNPYQIQRVSNKYNIDVYIPVPKTPKDKSDMEFLYDAEKDVYSCPQGKELIIVSRNQKHKNAIYDIYQCKQCQGCPIRNKCTQAKRGKAIKRYKNQEFRDQHKKKMKSKTGQYLSRIRKTIVEHPFGTIKMLMGKIPILLRGKKHVSTEIDLYTFAYNFKRLTNIEDFNTLMDKIMVYNWKI